MFKKNFIIRKFNHIIEKIKENNFYKNLFRNSFWAFAGDSIASIINLIITVLLLKLIGSNYYGLLVLAQSYMQVLDSIFNVQCWKGIIQFGQKCLLKKDYKSLNEYVKLGFLIDLITAVIGGLIAFLLIDLIGKVFNWDETLIYCAKIFSLTIFSHLSGTSTAILRILDKFNFVALQKFLTSVIKLIAFFIIFLLFNNLSIKSIVIVYCISDVVGNLLLIVFCLCIYLKKTTIKKLFFSNLPKNKKEFISFTLWSTISDIVDIPVNYFDVFIVSLLGNNLVSVYKIFKQIVSILSKVTSAIQQAIMPQFSELYALGKKADGFIIVLKIKNLILKTCLPIVFILGLLSPIFLKIIYGTLYSDYWYVLFFYLIIQVFALSYTTIHPFFVSLTLNRSNALYTLLSNVIYIILAYFLVNQIGILGIVISFLFQSFTLIYLKKYTIISILKKEKRYL